MRTPCPYCPLTDSTISVIFPLQSLDRDGETRPTWPNARRRGDDEGDYHERHVDLGSELAYNNNPSYEKYHEARDDQVSNERSSSHTRVKQLDLQGRVFKNEIPFHSHHPGGTHVRMLGATPATALLRDSKPRDICPRGLYLYYFFFNSQTFHAVWNSATAVSAKAWFSTIIATIFPTNVTNATRLS